MVNSRLGLVTATPLGSRREVLHLMGALLIPKLRSQYAEFLNERSLIRLGILSLPTCVGLRYGQPANSLEVFLGGMGSASWFGTKPHFPAGLEVCESRICLGLPLRQRPHTSSRAYAYPSASPHRSTRASWCRNVDLLSIGYAFRPRLRIRLTLRGLTFLRKP